MLMMWCDVNLKSLPVWQRALCHMCVHVHCALCTCVYDRVRVVAVSADLGKACPYVSRLCQRPAESFLLTCGGAVLPAQTVRIKQRVVQECHVVRMGLLVPLR